MTEFKTLSLDKQHEWQFFSLLFHVCNATPKSAKAAAVLETNPYANVFKMRAEQDDHQPPISFPLEEWLQNDEDFDMGFEGSFIQNLVNCELDDFLMLYIRRADRGSVLQRLARIWHQADIAYFDKQLHTRHIWKSLQNAKTFDPLSKFESLKEACVNFSALWLSCADFFSSKILPLSETEVSFDE